MLLIDRHNRGTILGRLIVKSDRHEESHMRMQVLNFRLRGVGEPWRRGRFRAVRAASGNSTLAILSLRQRQHNDKR